MANIKHKEKFMDYNLFSEHTSEVNVNKNPAQITIQKDLPMMELVK